MNKQSGISVLQLILIIVLGILIASFIERVAGLMLIGTIIKGFDNAIKKNLPDDRYNKRIYTPSTYQSPALEVRKNVTEPIVNEMVEQTTSVIKQMGSNMMKNIELDKEFGQQYKSPAECKNAKNVETLEKCTNAYRIARTDFANKKAAEQAKKERFSVIHNNEKECRASKTQQATCSYISVVNVKEKVQPSSNK